ncbi:MAG: hypothetical protein DI551_01100 [Micavibrio aeruginosavorus]|uniref:Uncharacterized protein n=1 Tax=Micavibrio aeruginosavorus TaxID=349221 RepID=A0A2W5QBC6_9BACT|nr:MAG: hypothetical protein DI551_01100 [Micavibrio aeruginosavorus]
MNADTLGFFLFRNEILLTKLFGRRQIESYNTLFLIIFLTIAAFLPYSGIRQKPPKRAALPALLGREGRQIANQRTKAD